MWSTLVVKFLTASVQIQASVINYQQRVEIVYDLTKDLRKNSEKSCPSGNNKNTESF